MAKSPDAKVIDAQIAAKFKVNPWLFSLVDTISKPGIPACLAWRKKIMTLKAAVLTKNPDMEATLAKAMPNVIGTLSVDLERAPASTEVDAWLRARLLEKSTYQSISHTYTTTMAPQWFLPVQWILGSNERQGLVNEKFLAVDGKTLDDNAAREFIYKLVKGDRATRADWRSFSFWSEEMMDDYLALMDRTDVPQITEYPVLAGEVVHFAPKIDTELAEKNQAMLKEVTARLVNKRKVAQSAREAYVAFAERYNAAKVVDQKKMKAELDSLLEAAKKSKADKVRYDENVRLAQEAVDASDALAKVGPDPERYVQIQSKVYKRILRAMRVMAIESEDLGDKEIAKKLRPYKGLRSHANGSYVYPDAVTFNFDPSKLEKNVIVFSDSEGERIVYPTYALRIYMETYKEHMLATARHASEHAASAAAVAVKPKGRSTPKKKRDPSAIELSASEAEGNDASEEEEKQRLMKKEKKTSAPRVEDEKNKKAKKDAAPPLSEEEEEEPVPAKHEQKRHVAPTLDEEEEEEDAPVAELPKKKKVPATPEKPIKATKKAVAPPLESEDEEVTIVPVPIVKEKKKKTPSDAMDLEVVKMKKTEPDRIFTIPQKTAADVVRMAKEAEEQGRKRAKSDLSSDESLSELKPPSKKPKIAAASKAAESASKKRLKSELSSDESAKKAKPAEKKIKKEEVKQRAIQLDDEEEEEDDANGPSSRSEEEEEKPTPKVKSAPIVNLASAEKNDKEKEKKKKTLIPVSTWTPPEPSYEDVLFAGFPQGFERLEDIVADVGDDLIRVRETEKKMLSEAKIAHFNVNNPSDELIPSTTELRDAFTAQDNKTPVNPVTLARAYLTAPNVHRIVMMAAEQIRAQVAAPEENYEATLIDYMQQSTGIDHITRLLTMCAGANQLALIDLKA